MTVAFRITGKRRASKSEVLRCRGEGRYNHQPDATETAYFAVTIPTAWREVSARAGGAVTANPEAFSSWSISLDNLQLIDVRDAAQLKQAGISEPELTADSPSVIAALRNFAKQVRLGGEEVDGIIYPSARDSPDGVCIVLFLESAFDKLQVEQVPQDEFFEAIGYVT